VNRPPWAPDLFPAARGTHFLRSNSFAIIVGDSYAGA
jgi:hypothetical protein